MSLRRMGSWFVALGASLVIVVGLAGTVGRAQADRTNQATISIEYQNKDVREALRELFKQANTYYAVFPEVQGVVTISLKNVTFDTALQNILRQVDATYRVEGEIYSIFRRSAAPSYLMNANPIDMTSNLPVAMVGDKDYLYIVKGKVLFKVGKQKLDIQVKELYNPSGAIRIVN